MTFDCLVTETPPSIGEVSKIELLRSRLKTGIPLHDLESLSDTEVLAKNVCTIVDQIKHLRTAIENTIELSKIKSNKTDGYDRKFSLNLLFASLILFFFVISEQG